MPLFFDPQLAEMVEARVQALVHEQIVLALEGRGVPSAAANALATAQLNEQAQAHK